MKIKCSLHNHTTCSDGELSPDQLLVYLRDAGFNVIAITDHMNLTVPWKIPEGILFIHGIEWYSRQGYEMVLLNPHLSMEKNYLDLSQTPVKWLAHPAFLGGYRYMGINLKAVASIIQTNKLDGYELYNGHHKQLSEEDVEVLAQLMDMPYHPFAVDDFHVKGQEMQAWVEMEVDSLDVDTVIENLVSGQFDIGVRS